MLRTPALIVAIVASCWAIESRAEECSCLVPDFNRSYENADHVVHLRVLRLLGQAGGQRYYLAVTEERAFKGCLPTRRQVVLQTPASSAVFEMLLRIGESYLLHGRAAGRRLGLPVLAVALCDANEVWSDLSPEHRHFLDTRFVCCGGRCRCVGTEEVQCFVDPCEVSTCDVEGAQCRVNRCGGCNAEWVDPSGALVCEAAGGDSKEYRVVELPTGLIRVAVLARDDAQQTCTGVVLVYGGGEVPDPAVTLPPGWDLERAFRTTNPEDCESLIVPSGTPASAVTGTITVTAAPAFCELDIDMSLAFGPDTGPLPPIETLRTTGIEAPAVMCQLQVP